MEPVLETDSSTIPSFSRNRYDRIRPATAINTTNRNIPARINTSAFLPASMCADLENSSFEPRTVFLKPAPPIEYENSTIPATKNKPAISTSIKSPMVSMKLTPNEANKKDTRPSLNIAPAATSNDRKRILGNVNITGLPKPVFTTGN